VILGEKGDHLFDLHDLFRGAAKKTKQGFAEGLPGQAQAGESGEAGGEMRIAAPGQLIGEGGEVGVESQVVAEGRKVVGRTLRCAAEQFSAGIEGQLGDVFRPDAGPHAGVIAAPAKALTAIEGLGEDRVRKSQPER
jgi:hypothetical protein